MNVVKTGLMIAALSGLTSTAAAEVLVDEDFNYANGALTTVSGGTWTAFSGAGNNPVQVSNQAITLVQGSGSREDVSISLGDTIGTGEVWYAGFDVTVSGASSTVYFAFFRGDNLDFRGRLYVTGPANLGYRLAVGESSSITATWGSDLNFGQTYRVMLAYNFDAGTTRMWVDPTSEGDAHITSTAFTPFAVKNFSFRQADATSTQIIDNLIVSTSFAEAVPEPGSLALLGLGGLLACRRRR